MMTQSGTLAYPIHATMKVSVRFQVQISSVHVPLVGKVKDVKVCIYMNGKFANR